ncbi:zinc knuckle CX2CX4HX4C containing protein [Tanacetum coccineum]
MNEEKVLGAHVALPLAAVQEISAKFDHTLYGYFIGSSLAFPIVNNYVRNAWAKYGVESTIVRDGFFLFKFSSHEGLIKVLDKGPWFIRSRPLMLNTWSANTKMKKIVQGFREMCLNPWGPKTYARVLIELSADQALMDSVIVAVPFPNGTGHSLENLDVEYEWRPSRCSKCKIFGHDDAFCPSKDKRVALNSSTGTGSLFNLGSEGGKQSSKSKPIHGIRFSKPKPKFFYRPVSKVSQGETMTTPPAKEDTNSDGDQPSESLVAAMENIPSDTGKSKFIQDDINLGDLRNTMDKLMEEDKVLDINTDDIGNKTSTHTTECSNISQTVQSEAKTQVNGSLWERFTEVKKASTTDSDSEVEEIYSFDYNKANYVASASGEFTLEDDDLDCYDGYEAQLYDLSDEMQKFCDHYDVRLKSRLDASEWKHMERFTEVKKASKTDSDSEVEEVYSFDYNKSNYIATASVEFTLEDDDLYCYDGYEAQLYDLSDEMQKFCDHYDVRLKSRVRK